MSFTTVWKPDMRIGFAYDLKTTFGFNADSPEDAGEEYDSPDTIQLIEGSLASLGHQVLRFGGGQELLDLCHMALKTQVPPPGPLQL